MTEKILIDKQVVEQALDALEDLRKYGVKQSKALFALREALKVSNNVGNAKEVNTKGVNATEPVALQPDPAATLHPELYREMWNIRHPDIPAPTQQDGTITLRQKDMKVLFRN